MLPALPLSMHNVSEPGLPVHICTLIKSGGRKVAASVWECNVGIVLPTSAILSLEKRDYIMSCSQLTLCGHREAALQTDSVQRAVKKHTHTHLKFYSTDVCSWARAQCSNFKKRLCVCVFVFWVDGKIFLCVSRASLNRCKWAQP